MLKNGVCHHMISRVKVPTVRSHDNELPRGRSTAPFLPLHVDVDSGLNRRPGGRLAEKGGSTASAPRVLISPGSDPSSSDEPPYPSLPAQS